MSMLVLAIRRKIETSWMLKGAGLFPPLFFCYAKMPILA